MIPPIRWSIIVPIALIGAVVLLVGLPLGTVFIVNNSGCCLANGPEDVVTFWASMMAGFLALFGMIVTAVFIITAFRVDATARAKAQVAARQEVWTYIGQYRKKLFRELSELKKLAPEVRKAMTAARDEVEAQRGEASLVITGAQSEITDAAAETQKTIGEAQDETTNAARRAQETIEETRQEVERQRAEVISAIDRAREEVEAAAQAARDRIDRAGDAPQDDDGPD